MKTIKRSMILPWILFGMLYGRGLLDQLENGKETSVVEEWGWGALKKCLHMIEVSTTLSADVKKTSKEAFNKFEQKLSEFDRICKKDETIYHEAQKSVSDYIEKMRVENKKMHQGLNGKTYKDFDGALAKVDNENVKMNRELENKKNEEKKCWNKYKESYDNVLRFRDRPEYQKMYENIHHLAYPSPNFNEKLALKQLKAIANGSLDFDNSALTDSTRVVDVRNAEIPVKNMPAEIQNSPGVREARKGYQCMESKDWAAAKAWFQQALLKDPTNESLKKQVAICDQKMKEKK